MNTRCKCVKKLMENKQFKEKLTKKMHNKKTLTAKKNLPNK